MWMGWFVAVILAVAVVLLAVLAIVQTLLICLQARLLGFLARVSFERRQSPDDSIILINQIKHSIYSIDIHL